jgi:hypothetical protein
LSIDSVNNERGVPGVALTPFFLSIGRVAGVVCLENG